MDRTKQKQTRKGKLPCKNVFMGLLNRSSNEYNASSKIVPSGVVILTLQIGPPDVLSLEIIPSFTSTDIEPFE
ncbi:hypothetical protein [Flavobacterium sp. GNP002]